MKTTPPFIAGPSLADAVGALVGLCVPLALLPAMSMVERRHESLTQLGLLLLAAVTAGFVAVLFKRLISPTQGSQGSARFGLRAGFACAMIGGGLLTFLSRSDVLKAETAIEDVISRQVTWTRMFVGLSALLPAVVCGSVGGTFASLIAKKTSQTSKQNAYPENSARWWGWAYGSVASLSMACFASPLTILGRPIRVDPGPASVATMPLPEPPPPPPFRYEKPKNFEEAHAGHIFLEARKPIEPVFGDRPVLISPDSRLMAYCPASNGNSTVKVIELDTLRTVASFHLHTPPGHLAWSPDLRRLFCLTTNSTPVLTVLDVSTSSAMTLPRPKGQDTPVGPCRWWKSNEVIFYPADGNGPLSLNLDGLRLRSFDEVLRLKPEDALTASGLKNLPTIAFPASKAWQMELAPLVKAVVAPPRNASSQPWDLKSIVAVAFRSPQQNVTYALSDVVVDASDRLVASPDGSKLVLLHGRSAEILYFGVSPRRTSSLSAVMAMQRDAIKGNAPDGKAAEALSAFAYAPMINPLNGYTVGPNRERVRALLRVVQWNGGSAEFSPSEQFQHVKDGDVIADMHTWEDGRMIPSGRIDEDWWAPVVIDNAIEQHGIPAMDSVVRPPVFQTNASTYVLQVGMPQRPAKPPLEVPPPKPAVVASTPAKREKAEGDVAQFIIEHHRKATAGDIDGMVEDYGSWVDFHQKGLIQRDQIKAEELASRGPYPKSIETIAGPISIRKEDQVWNAAYTIDFRNENDSGASFTGKANIVLRIEEDADMLAITSQKATAYDTKRVNSRSEPTSAVQKPPGLPSVKLRLPAPVWTTANTVQFGNETVSIHEAIGLSQRRLTIHRTYRVLVGANTSKALADKHPNGVISMQTAEIQGTITSNGTNGFTAYIGTQGWVRDPDASAGEWNAQCEKHAASGMGARIPFNFDGEDLVSGGVRFKLAKKAGSR